MSSTPEQRRAALQIANQTRTDAANLRHRIHSAGKVDGALLAADVVRHATAHLRYFDLLRAVPWIGETKAKRMLSHAHINPEQWVDSDVVTAHRRGVLYGELVAHANGRQR